MTPIYKRPPVIEALFEVRFASELDVAGLSKARKAFDRRYDNVSEELGYEIRIDQSSQGAKSLGLSALRFDRRDATEIVILRKEGIVMSLLAPYQGWDYFSSFIVGELSSLIRSVGEGKRISRYGMRFINRIDIPFVGHVTALDRYITVLPRRVGVLGAASSNLACHIGAMDFNPYLANLNVSTASSPLINHGAIVVDVDVYREYEASISDVAVELDRVRRLKNEIFEAAITDSSRALFNA